MTALRPKDQLRKQQCVGLPLPATHIKILDPNGRELPSGEVGELYSTSNHMFSGYLNMPDAMAKAMRGEWFSAGDLGRIDDEGYLYLVDRKHDMIISGGENVYPREVEEVLLAHPRDRSGRRRRIAARALGRAGGGLCRGPGWNERHERRAQGRMPARLSRYKVPKEFAWSATCPGIGWERSDRRELRELNRKA